MPRRSITGHRRNLVLGLLIGGLTFLDGCAEQPKPRPRQIAYQAQTQILGAVSAARAAHH